MRLSAQLLDTYDRCERRYAFERGWESKSISPLGLLYAALDAALIASDPEQAAKDETMRVAQHSELDAGNANQFMVVRHTGYLAGIIAVALREKLGLLNRVAPTAEWESALLFNEHGRKFRVELVSHWDDDRLRAAAHSWRVLGELAALEAPLTLVAVVIGPARAGKRHSAWTKALKHPNLPGLRFARRQKKENGFAGSYEEVWRDQRGEISTAAWLNGMTADGVLDQLILTREIAYRVDDARMVAAKREMKVLEILMEGASTAAPMRRSSCDETGRGACPFQSVCYAPVETDPSSLLHLYRPKRTSSPVAQSQQA